MKILIIDSGTLCKDLTNALKKKHTLTFAKEFDLKKAEDLKTVFKDGSFEAVIFSATDFSLKNNTVDLDALVRFKNVQYASILYGVKKLIVLNKAFSKQREDGLEVGSKALVMDEKLICSMISSLATKDKISTVLNVYEIFGKGFKDGTCAKILSALKAKKTLVQTEDYSFFTIYSEDAVKVLTEFIEKDYKNGEYDLINNESITVNEFIKKVKQVAKKRSITFNIDTKKLKPVENEGFQNSDGLTQVLPNLKFTSINSAINKIMDK